MKITRSALVLAGLWLLPTVGLAGLDDSGTIILGGGLGYGTVFGESRYGSEFSDGRNYFFTAKFMISRNMAFGVHFQNQAFAATDLLPSLPTAGLVKEVIMVNYEAHLIYYFNRVADASRYVDIGLGLYRPELRSQDVSTGFPSTALALSAAVGVEVFVRPQMSLDLSVRGVGYLGKGYTESEELSEGLTPDDRLIIENTGSISGSIQGQVGILFYLFD